jgi:hypothetical protein
LLLDQQIQVTLIRFGEFTMQTTQSGYFSQYRSLKLTRDDNGVLVAEFHTDGGAFTFTAQDHTEVVDAFYRISQDRANKIVILTGAGGDFITVLTGHPLATLAIPEFGARSTMKAFRLWKT